MSAVIAMKRVTLWLCRRAHLLALLVVIFIFWRSALFVSMIADFELGLEFSSFCSEFEDERESREFKALQSLEL